MRLHYLHRCTLNSINVNDLLITSNVYNWPSALNGTKIVFNCHWIAV